MAKLEVDEGRVYGARYWTVKPIPSWELYHDDWGGVDIWNSMFEWCIDTFGPTPDDGVWTPGSRWYVNNAKFWFRTEADRDWFLLRWK